MLDTHRPQTQGLHGIPLRAAQHVIVVASHGDWQGELPLLWNLCSAWSAMSYSIAVLDATAAESDHNPGLQQLLNNIHVPLWDDDDCTNWAIFPAALGLEQLGASVLAGATLEPIQVLGHLLENYEIILIYANALDLATCLPGSGIEPLLPVSMRQMSIVPAYQALKHLMVKGKLHPSTVAIVDTSNPAHLLSAHRVNKSIQDCAFNFLGEQIPALIAPSEPMDGQNANAIKTLALRLLERSVSLRPDAFAIPQGHTPAFDSFPSARSH